MNFFALLRKENLEIIRSKKLLALIIIFAFVAISSPILAKILPELLKNIDTGGMMVLNIPEPSWRDAIDQLVKNASQFGIIVIIFMFAGAVSTEKSKKTLEILLTKPISRTNFILSKFFSGFLHITWVFILSQIVFYLYSVSLFGSFSYRNFAWLSLFFLVLLLTVFSLTLFCSTISKSSTMATVLAFSTSIIFSTGIGYVSKLKNYSPSFIISNYKDLMDTGNYQAMIHSLLASIAIIILLITFSVFFFSRQEIER